MILLDVNGTLIDLTAAKNAIFEEVTLRNFRKWGFKGSPEHLKKTFAEVDEDLKYKIHNLETYPREVAHRLKLKASDDELSQENSEFKKAIIKKAHLMQGVQEALKRLSKISDLVVFSNGWNELVFPLLEKFDILNYFSDVVCIGGTGMNKERGQAFPELRQRGAWAIIGDNSKVDGMGEKMGISFVDVGQGWEQVIKKISDLKRQRGK
ncbi:MAG: HAD family hydrolase [Candidatus Altiarchaeota archaeon]|nr:HAD family hydrolase [Candidatus Altiarchaeota archaeon]